MQKLIWRDYIKDKRYTREYVAVQLNSCLEELRNILGDSTPEHVLVDAVIKENFDLEKALNSILNTAGKFKCSNLKRQVSKKRKLFICGRISRDRYTVFSGCYFYFRDTQATKRPNVKKEK